MAAFCWQNLCWETVVGGGDRWGHFGRIVAVLRLAATTSGISPRSGPDDSLVDLSFER
jgi:hypothetical protein